MCVHIRTTGHLCMSVFTKRRFVASHPEPPKLVQNGCPGGPSQLLVPSTPIDDHVRSRPKATMSVSNSGWSLKSHPKKRSTSTSWAGLHGDKPRPIFARTTSCRVKQPPLGNFLRGLPCLRQLLKATSCKSVALFRKN